MKATFEVIGRTAGPILVIRCPRRLPRNGDLGRVLEEVCQTVAAHLANHETTFPLSAATWTARMLDQ